MRLRGPTTQHLESEDGACSLTYEGVDQSPQQAGGGALYMLRVSQPEGVTEIRAVIQSTTSYHAEKYAESKGDKFDYITMNITAIREYVEEYAEKYGTSSKIIDFYYADEHGDARHRPINNISYYADIFCKMYLKLNASYKYNNSEYPDCGEGYYPNSVEFRPWGGDPAHIKVYTAAEAFND